MPHLPDAVGTVALALARGAIADALRVDRQERPLDSPPELDQPAATFVTLTCAGQLRGCIGSLAVRRTLRDDVVHNALAAAFEDPRFGRLRADEYARLALEISVLSPMEPFRAASHADACASLRPHVDGVLLECDGRRATFLPQVWADVESPHEFLVMLKKKAGFDAGFWSAGLRLSRYTVLKWCEPGSRSRAP